MSFKLFYICMYAHIYYVTIMKAQPKKTQKALEQHMQAEFFKALCDPVRVAMVISLASQTKEQTVSDVTQCCGIDFSGVSRHLKILRDAGIVQSHKKGRHTFYSLNAEFLISTFHNIANCLQSCEKENH